LAVARSGICCEIFNEAVDIGYIRSKTLGENEIERVLNLVRMKKVQGVWAESQAGGFED